MKQETPIMEDHDEIERMLKRFEKLGKVLARAQARLVGAIGNMEIGRGDLIKAVAQASNDLEEAINILTMK
jgi:hypothetical protein